MPQSDRKHQNEAETTPKKEDHNLDILNFLRDKYRVKGPGIGWFSS
jgi:hypothetical protein